MPRRVHIAPLRVRQDEFGIGKLVDRDRTVHRPAREVDGLRGPFDRADVEAAIVDRKCHESGFKIAPPHGLGDLPGVELQDAHPHQGVQSAEVHHQVGVQQMVRAARTRSSRRPV